VIEYGIIDWQIDDAVLDDQCFFNWHIMAVCNHIMQSRDKNFVENQLELKSTGRSQRIYLIMCFQENLIKCVAGIQCKFI
jgi:hypothetical protein